MEFVLYNVTSISGFTYMLTVLYANTRMLWVFPTLSKKSHVRIIRLIITPLKNEQYPYKSVRVDEDGDLEN